MHNILTVYIKAYRSTVHRYWGKIKRLCPFKDRISHSVVRLTSSFSPVAPPYKPSCFKKKGLPVHWIVNSFIKQLRNNNIRIKAVIFLPEGITLSIRNSYFVSQILNMDSNRWIIGELAACCLRLHITMQPCILLNDLCG